MKQSNLPDKLERLSTDVKTPIQIQYSPATEDQPASIKLDNGVVYIDSEEKSEKGVYGSVHRFVEKTKKDRCIAVKFIPVDSDSPETYKDRLSEAQCDVKILNHLLQLKKDYPNVCAVGYCELKDQNLILVVTPFIEGSTLKVALANTKTLKDFIDLLYRSLLALEILHNTVIHLDLKDDNIMVDPNKNIIYIDFSTSRFLGEIAYLSGKNARHIPPECRYGEETASTPPPPSPAHPRQDIFSFGYMSILNIQEKIEKLTHDGQKEFLRSFEKKLEKATSSDPSKRPNIVELIDLFLEMQLKLEVSDEIPNEFNFDPRVNTADKSNASHQQLTPSSFTLYYLIPRQNIKNVFGLFWHACYSLTLHHQQDYVAIQSDELKSIVVTLDETKNVKNVVFPTRKLRRDEDSQKRKEKDFVNFKNKILQFIHYEIKHSSKNIINKSITPEDVKLLNSLSTDLKSSSSLKNIIDILEAIFYLPNKSAENASTASVSDCHTENSPSLLDSKPEDHTKEVPNLTQVTDNDASFFANKKLKKNPTSFEATPVYEP